MSKVERKIVPAEEVERQKGIMHTVRRLTGGGKTCFVETYGCQQNVSDSEILLGMLSEMGFEKTDNKENADLILYNTCAVRENAGA